MPEQSCRKLVLKVYWSTLVLYGDTSVVEGNIITLVSNVQYTEQGLIKRVIRENVSWHCYICGWESDISGARRPCNDAIGELYDERMRCGMDCKLCSNSIIFADKSFVGTRVCAYEFFGRGINWGRRKKTCSSFFILLNVRQRRTKTNTFTWFWFKVSFMASPSGFSTGRGGT